jgi:hypothetical protein
VHVHLRGEEVRDGVGGVFEMHGKKEMDNYSVFRSDYEIHYYVR